MSQSVLTSPATTSVQSFVGERLRNEGIGLVTRERFADLLAQLLAAGVLWREYSHAEAQLYDDALQCEPLLREWFAVAGFTLAHDADAGLMRLYPPSRRAALHDDRLPDEDQPPARAALRACLSRDFVAACIVLRQLYTEGLTGQRELVNQELPILLEELVLAAEALLGHALPSTAAERRVLLNELRHHRVIRFQGGESAGGMDTGLSVLRPVMSYVSDEALEEALRLTDPDRRGATPDSELGALM